MKTYTYKSVAKWPDSVSLGTPENESEDYHATRRNAEVVCSLLRLHGFGGMGKIFPLETRVEEVERRPSHYEGSGPRRYDW